MVEGGCPTYALSGKLSVLESAPISGNTRWASRPLSATNSLRIATARRDSGMSRESPFLVIYNVITSRRPTPQRTMTLGWTDAICIRRYIGRVRIAYILRQSGRNSTRDCQDVLILNSIKDLLRHRSRVGRGRGISAQPPSRSLNKRCSPHLASPSESLRQRVDLIVVTAGERK
jgi:hypothetical protein